MSFFFILDLVMLLIIYLDVVFIINLIYDFLLLITVSIVLKRKTKFKRLFLGSLIGGISIFILFININSFLLFLLKVFISILMILISFGKCNFVKNIVYLYFISILLSGFVYFINGLFSYRVEGIVFVNNGFSINIIVILFLSPIILYFYIKENRYLRNSVSNKHKVVIKFNNEIFNYDGYLDTGNKLVDPYLRRPVSLVYDDIKCDKYIYVPYSTISGDGLIKCIVVDEMILDDKHVFNKVLIGIVDNCFNLESCKIILNSSYNDIFC